MFCDVDGWKICADACKEGDSTLMRRTLFFFTALLQEESAVDRTIAAMLANGVIDLVIGVLDVDLDEPVLEEYLRWLDAVCVVSKDAMVEYREDAMERVEGLKIREWGIEVVGLMKSFESFLSS